AFSPNGQYVLTGSTDKTARLWEVAKGITVRIFSGHGNYVSSAIFSSDGKRVLTGSWDGSARLWDAANGQLIRQCVDPNKSSPVNSVAPSPDGKYLVTGGGSGDSPGGESVARLWDVSSGQLLRTFKGHTSGVDSVAFSPDGKYVLTGSRDWTA